MSLAFSMTFVFVKTFGNVCLNFGVNERVNVVMFCTVENNRR
jgi:hypothetical protein